MKKSFFAEQKKQPWCAFCAPPHTKIHKLAFTAFSIALWNKDGRSLTRKTPFGAQGLPPSRPLLVMIIGGNPSVFSRE